MNARDARETPIYPPAMGADRLENGTSPDSRGAPMEYAGSPFEIKQLNDSGHIEGLLAGFGNVDHGGDKLLPGCLTKTLAARSTPLPMLLHHDQKRPIGAWKEWQERAEGLYVKGALTLAIRDAQEAHALAKDGALTGLSIGWQPKQSSRDSSGARIVTEADLFEGSLVAIPMNDKTRVSAIKSIHGARDIEEMLKEGGLSGRKAMRAASAAWKAINEQDDEAAAEAEMAALIKASISRLNAFGGQ
ncbi:HK97 family phage prohead protease [Sphingosinicella sp. LY1275]|uniref:HK97 family phage prohead protease n=1 Tax=Sphingosinicella sp. LY1275 TaxID=3095379 RepID=UPI002ADEF614|nr:HK97 family phage prohead protease [Sphingosinicella sp. LY1275]MEA1015594.1 HK97 family phage prohead protease [Sphingosinicella sp. LY1275]